MSAAAMGSLLVDTAQHYTDKMIDYSNQKNFNRQAQSNYEKNQNALYRYGQQEEKNRSSNEVMGLIQAGISPALANGDASGNVAVAPSSSVGDAPKGSFSPSSSLQKGAERENLEKQNELLDAEIEKKREETAELSLKNSETESKNDTITLNVESLCDKNIAESQKQETESEKLTYRFYFKLKEQINDGKLRPNEGTLKGIQLFNQALNSSLESEKYREQLLQDIKVLRLQDKNGIAEILAFAPKFQQKLIWSETKENLASVDKLLSGIRLDSAEIQKLEEEGKKIAKETLIMGADDTMAQIVQGNYGAAFVNEALHLVHSVEDLGMGAGRMKILGNMLSQQNAAKSLADDMRQASEQAFKTQLSREERAWKTKRDSKEFERSKTLKELSRPMDYDEWEDYDKIQKAKHRSRRYH